MNKISKSMVLKTIAFTLGFLLIGVPVALITGAWIEDTFWSESMDQICMHVTHCREAGIPIEYCCLEGADGARWCNAT